MFRNSEIFKYLASLKLAILLLAGIILAVAFGTYYETQFNAEIAHQRVYGAVWFDFWLVLLCINLFSVAAIRYPWKPHQTGFVITHAGIIILLIGALIDRHWGIEGYLELHRGHPPTDVMELREQQLVVSVEGQEPGKKGWQSAYTKLNEKADSHFVAQSPAPDVKVEVTDNRDVVAHRFYVKSESGPPAMRLQLRGAVMGVQPAHWLRVGEQTNLMMAMVGFLPGEPPPVPKTGEKPAADDGAADMHPRRERIWVFAKQPEVMATTLVGEPTQAAAILTLDPKTSEPMLNVKLMGKDFTVAVQPNIGKPVDLDGLEGWKLFVGGYFPNFRMMPSGQPGDVNDKPDNPAVKFELLGPLVKGQVHDSASGHGGHGAHNGAEGAGAMGIGDTPSNGLTIYLGNDGKLRYLVKSRAKGEFSGEVELGKYTSLQWGASGAEFAVDEFYPHTDIKLDWRVAKSEGAGDDPIADDVSLPLPEELRGARAGLKCHITAGDQTQEFWLGKRVLQSVPGDKTLVELPRETYEIGNRTIGLSFCNQFVILPFKVGLLKFAAPTDEGTDMSFASFESTLSFDGHRDLISLKPEAQILKQADRNGELPEALNGGRNRDLFGAIMAEDAADLTMEFDNGQSLTVPKSDVASWTHKSQKIYMNYPTTYPSTWYGPWLGTTYKFSQAEHHMPADPNFSGVQVLRDPGWMPKWVGCLMICFGIFTMFYLKPYFNRRSMPAAAKAAVSDSRDAAVDKGKKRGKMAETRSV